MCIFPLYGKPNEKRVSVGEKNSKMDYKELFYPMTPGDFISFEYSNNRMKLFRYSS